VHHSAHIAAVDTHAERVGGDHDVDRAGDKLRLHPLSLFWAKPGVEDRRAPAEAAQTLRFGFGTLAGQGVKNGGAARSASRLQRLDQDGIHEFFAFARR